MLQTAERLIERRMHKRHTANTKVFVRIPNRKVIHTHVINLSAGGAFIRLTSVHSKMIGVYIELTFAINLGGITKLHHRKAKIIHIDKLGTGVEFASIR